MEDRKRNFMTYLLPAGSPGQKVFVLLPVLLVVLLLFPETAATGGIHKKAGTTGFPFLKLGVGARAVAMGGAFTAMADDPTTIYYNPAGTMNLEVRQFLAGYHNYILDIQSGFVAVTIPFTEGKSVGFFIDYLNFGDFTETNEHGEPTGEFSGGDFLLGANFSTRLYQELIAGINVKFMSETAAGYSAEALAADFGLYYKFRDTLTTVGFTVSNLGFVLSGFSSGSAGEHKDDLPFSIRAGVAHSLRELPVVAALDAVLPNDNDPYLNIGMEMYELEPLYLRLGYSTFGENYKTGSNDSALGGFSFGFGLDHKNYHIAYGFTPYLDLGTSHRVTVTGEF